MKYLPAIIIMMTAGLIICLSGCGRNNSAWVDPPDLVIPGDRHMDASYHNGAAVSGPDDIRYSADVWNTDALDTAAFRSDSSPNAFMTVTDRILAAVHEWNDYRSELASGTIDRGQVTEPEESAKLSLPANEIMANDPFIPEYVDSTDYLNWQMRVLLLESRLSAASSESEKGMLQAKLEKAKISLRDAESIFRRPETQNTVVTEPAVANQPVNQEPAVIPDDNLVVATSHFVPEKRITGTLKSIGKTSYTASVKGSDNKQKLQTVYSKYYKIQSETISKIDGVIGQLRVRGNSRAPENL